MEEKLSFNKRSFLYALAISIAGFLFFILFDAFRGSRILTHIIGLDGFLFARRYLIAAVVFLFFKKTRMIAAALFLSAGLMLLIGYTFCSFPVIQGPVQ
jgi:hypothetical protein